MSFILASLNNCFKIEAAKDSLFISDASTTNSNRSVSCKNAVQYFLVASEPPTADNVTFNHTSYITIGSR